jgi:hypothetical protein
MGIGGTCHREIMINKKSDVFSLLFFLLRASPTTPT